MISITKRIVTSVLICYTLVSVFLYFTTRNRTPVVATDDNVPGEIKYINSGPNTDFKPTAQETSTERSEQQDMVRELTVIGEAKIISEKREKDREETEQQQPKEDQVISKTAEPQKAPTPAKDNPDLAPCGEVCSYEGVLIENRTVPYPHRRKHIDCENIMRRMAYQDYPVVDPPPRSPPQDLLDAFTMSGQSPVDVYMYRKSLIAPNRVRNFTTVEINSMMSRLGRGIDVNTYAKGECAKDSLKKYRDRIRGGRGVVIGSISPWLEAILLSDGADHVTTLEYAPTRSLDPRLDIHMPYDFAEMFLAGKVEKFDFGASFSSIEHSGLGRYTDPINPYGDLEAMAQVWCMIKPGGMFGLGVPRSHDGLDKDFIVWNAHRVYGSKRLQHLTANWGAEEKTSCGGHHFIILTKEED